MHPIEENKRIDVLDYLRGFALLGILLVNIIPLLHIGMPEPDTVDAVYWKFLYLFVEGRFFTLFSFLFGVGFYLFITRANANGKNGTKLYVRRLISLFLIGIIHFSFQPGEALTVYAISGLLVLPLFKIKRETNLMIGLGLLLFFSMMGLKFLMPIPLIILGLAAGQHQLFTRLLHKRKQLWLVTGAALIVSLLALYYQTLQTPVRGEQESFARFYHAGIMMGPLVSCFYAGFLLLLLQNRLIAKLLAPLKYYGRMALTNYLGQTMFILAAGNVLGQISYVQTIYICAVIYLIQLIFSFIWLQFFRFGPLEWIWRIMTYLEIPPLKKQT